MADHRFVPTTFHNTLGPHDPVLTIESGDRVFTTTVDAGGFDASDIAVTPGGNPQTGPFRVAGAEPGDTLAVHLEQIRTVPRQTCPGTSPNPSNRSIRDLHPFDSCHPCSHFPGRFHRSAGIVAIQCRRDQRMALRA